MYYFTKVERSLYPQADETGPSENVLLSTISAQSFFTGKAEEFSIVVFFQLKFFLINEAVSIMEN